MTLPLYKELWVFTLPTKGPCLVALGLLPCPRISRGELWMMLSAAAEGLGLFLELSSRRVFSFIYFILLERGRQSGAKEKTGWERGKEDR